MFLQHDVTGAQVPLRHGLRYAIDRVSRHATRSTGEKSLPKRLSGSAADTSGP